MGYDRVYPILFPEYMTHYVVAEVMKVAVEEEIKIKPTVHSAGFCEISNDSIVVSRHGSESLGIKRNGKQEPKDQRMLNMPNALQGMLLC